MPCSCRPVEGHKTLAVCNISGRLDPLVLPQLEQELAALIEQGRSRLIVTMSELEFISAAGLNVFLRYAQQVKPRRGTLKFAAPNSNIRRVLMIAGFDQLFEILESEEEAIRTLAK